MKTLLDQLKASLNPSSLLIGDAISDKYFADWSGTKPCPPAVLLKPQTTEELSTIMSLCHQYDQPVVVQGGLTGLAGGATPQQGEFAISLERMNRIEAIDTTAMTMTACAGTPLQLLQEAAAEHDLFVPLDLGVMWATMSAAFATFVLYSARTLEIYAGFAVAITALLWLYLNWLILLIGAQIAFYHQRPAYLRIGRREPQLSNAMRERLVLDVMFLTGVAFRREDKVLTFRELSRTLKLPSLTMTPAINALENAGLLITTEKEELIPGREMSRISVGDILAVVRKTGETGSDKPPLWSAPVDELVSQVDSAVGGVVGEMTLSDLVDSRSDPL